MAIYLLLFDKRYNVWLLSLKIKFFPCLKSCLATILYKKSEQKAANIEERQRKKRAIQKDRNRFANKKSKFWFVRMHDKQKSCLNTQFVGNVPLFDAKFTFSHSFSHANKSKTSPKKRNW